MKFLKFSSTFKVFVASLAALSLAAIGSCDITTTYTATQTSLSGLYDASGTLITSLTNVSSVDYRLLYSTTQPTAFHVSSATGTYRARITYHFSNTSWQSYRSGSTIGAVGVKVMNYSSLGSGPIEQFLGDVGTGISTVYITNPAAPGLPAPSSVAFNDVKPKKILFSSLTIDPTDGKAGYVEYDSPAPSGTTNVWGTPLSDPHGFPWFGRVWLFPRWGVDGYSPTGSPQTYAVEAP